MASVAIQAEYIADALDFANEMKENGFEVSFGNLADGATKLGPPGDYVETGTAYIFPSEWKADFSNDVRIDDLFFFVSNEVVIEGIGNPEYYDEEQGLTIPQSDDFQASCGRMQVGSKEYSVRHAKPFKPDGITVIFYEIQVRL